MKRYTSELSEKQGKVYFLLRKAYKETGESPLLILSSLEQGKREHGLQELYDSMSEKERLEVAFFYMRGILRKNEAGR